MIPGNQNEPAFTTSREGTFLDNDTIETSDARVVRGNDEGIGRDARFVTKLRDAADTYVRA